VFGVVLELMKRYSNSFKQHAILNVAFVVAMFATAKGQDYYSTRPTQVEVVPTAYSSMMDNYYKSIWESPKTDYNSEALKLERDYEERNRAFQETLAQRRQATQDVLDASRRSIDELHEQTRKLHEERTRLLHEKMQQVNDELLKRANERARIAEESSRTAEIEKTAAINKANSEIKTLSGKLVALNEINSYLVSDNKRISDIRNILIPLIQNDKENQYPQLISTSDIENLRDKRIYSDKEILVALGTLSDDSRSSSYVRAMNEGHPVEEIMVWVNDLYRCIPISYHPETTSKESSVWSHFWSNIMHKIGL